MAIRQFVLSGAVLILSLSTVHAGPCNRVSRDAGSGDVPGYTGHTTGKAASRQHPPTQSMNEAVDNTATSSQDAQRQMQGKPTAAEQAQSAKRKDQEGC